MRTSLLRRLRVGAALTAVAAVALTGCASDPASTSDPSQVHSVTHARGTTDVPKDPQRVVVLEPVELDTAVALGVNPVGAAVASNVKGVPEYLGVDGVTPVGTVPEPDLEAIAALKPDLILGTESRNSKLYDQLGQIAPTVFVASHLDPWQKNVILIGEALGRKDEAQRLVDDFNKRCETIRKEFDVEGKTANLIRPSDETTLSVYGPNSFAGSALSCVGLTLPEMDWKNGLSASISPENILRAKADYVFVTTSDVDDRSTIPAAITANAKDFPSVTLVDTSYWISGVGPKGGSRVLDDIENFLEKQR